MSDESTSHHEKDKTRGERSAKLRALEHIHEQAYGRKLSSEDQIVAGNIVLSSEKEFSLTNSSSDTESNSFSDAASIRSNVCESVTGIETEPVIERSGTKTKKRQKDLRVTYEARRKEVLLLGCLRVRRELP